MFIDASFWIALMDTRDQNFGNAHARWRRTSGVEWRRITTNWTLYEALTFLNSRAKARHDLALGLLNLIDTSDTLIVDAAPFENAALDIFRTHSDKRWSVVDCASFVCIQERQSGFALSYDERDFQQAQTEFGFLLLGETIL